MGADQTSNTPTYGKAHGALGNREAPVPSTLLGIQAARGIAALLVVLYHAERALALPQYVGHPAWAGASSFGHAGVDFFFVLSGFIIAYVHRADLNQPSALRRYAARRAARIYPPYWAITAILLVLGTASHGLGSVPGPAVLLQTLLLTPGNHKLVLEVAWTLVHELSFYVLFGLAILDRRLAALAILAYVILGCAPLPEWAAPLHAWGAGWYDTLFVIGIAAAWATLHTPLPRPRTLALLGAAAFLVAGLAENAALLPAAGPLGRLAYGLASAAIVIGLAQAERAGRLPVAPAFAALGAASYSIYLVHSPLVGYAARAMLISGLLAQLPDWLAMTLDVAIAIVAGLAFHRWVERPLTGAAQRVFRPRSSRHAVTQP